MKLTEIVIFFVDNWRISEYNNVVVNGAVCCFLFYGGDGMVTYGEMLQFALVVIGIVGLCLAYTGGKKK